MKVKNDCRFFKGDVPCRPHKTKGVHCENCPDYDATEKNILVIKLAAIGDVIRTTPLLHRIEKGISRNQKYGGLREHRKYSLPKSM